MWHGGRQARRGAQGGSDLLRGHRAEHGKGPPVAGGRATLNLDSPFHHPFISTAFTKSFQHF
eukprot:3876898-Prymnesium_polylepis.1